MASESELEVYRAHREAQDKYAYFLLAAAGAAIGLAVTQTQGSALALSQLPLAAAVLSWGASFCAGCRHLAYVSCILYANHDLLRVQSGQHPETGMHPQMIEAASKGIEKAVESNSNKSMLFAKLQFRFLILGATLYVGWHVWEMYLRSIAVPTPLAP